MPVTLRKRKPTQSTAQTDDSPLSSPRVPRTSKTTTATVYKDDDPFEAAFNTFNDDSSQSESDVSDFASGRKKRKSTAALKKQAKKRKVLRKAPGPPPDPPEMSDVELEQDDEDQSNTSKPRITTTPAATVPYAGPTTISPTVIRIEVGAATTIDLNLADFICQSRLLTTSATPFALRTRSATETPPQSHVLSEDKSFLSLPSELRNRIYHMALVTDAPIVFHKRQNFARSGQFLRTCRTIAKEGTDMLYGQNSFHFERTSDRRGNFWQEIWKEVGFKDIRRFLGTIGNANIAKLKYLSFNLEDAPPYLTPELDPAERRFVNDPVLQRIFNQIAAHAVPSRIDVVFGGRSQVQLLDYHFLKALSSIKSHRPNFPKSVPGYPTRVADSVLDKLEPLMTVPETDGDKVNEKKIKKKIKIHFDRPTKASYSNFAW